MAELNKLQLAVGLDKDTVTLTIRCSDHYAAIELYDRVCKQAREGFVELELETVPRV